MKFKNIAIGLVSFGTILFLSTMIFSGISKATIASQQNNASNTNSPVAQTAADASYALADVQQHGDKTSCWTAINGEVYDLTKWIPRHPGGSMAILTLCGKDGSKMFNMMHGGNRRVSSQLAVFQIGALK